MSSRQDPREGRDELSAADADFLISSLFDLFARVPQRKPLESELRRLEPGKMGVRSVDAEECERIFAQVCGEIDAVISTYLTALKDAETNPQVLSFTLACLSHALTFGAKNYEAWQNAPHSGLGGQSPKQWCGSNGFHQLSELLFHRNE